MQIVCYSLIVNFDIATTKPNFPVGLDFEIMSPEGFQKLSGAATTDEEKEHLTLHMYNSGDFKTLRLTPKAEWQKKSFTLDFPEDYQQLKALAEAKGVGSRIAELF